MIEVLLVTVRVAASFPLNFTVVPLVKPVPVIVTDVPTGPLAGTKLVTVTGCTNTVKLALDPVPKFPHGPPMLTSIGPVVAPDGTAAVIEVLLVTVRVPATLFPLNVTITRPSRKPVPVIVTDVPTVPLTGEKFVTLTAGNTLKLALLVPVPALVVTEIGPLVAPEGTNAVIEVLLVTVHVRLAATVPLNFTIAPLAKPVPVIVTQASTGARAGKLVTVGAPERGVGAPGRLVPLITLRLTWLLLLVEETWALACAVQDPAPSSSAATASTRPGPMRRTIELTALNITAPPDAISRAEPTARSYTRAAVRDTDPR